MYVYTCIFITFMYMYVYTCIFITFMYMYVGDLVDELFNECCLDPRKQKITYEDFQRVVATSDFHTKLRLPI
jgi:hypothetical protein